MLVPAVVSDLKPTAPLQVRHYRLKRQRRFTSASIERGEVLGVLAKRGLNGLVYQVGQRFSASVLRRRHAF